MRQSHFISSVKPCHFSQSSLNLFRQFLLSLPRVTACDHQVELVATNEFARLGYRSLYPVLYCNFHFCLVFGVGLHRSCDIRFRNMFFTNFRDLGLPAVTFMLLPSCSTLPWPCMALLNIDPPIFSSSVMTCFTSSSLLSGFRIYLSPAVLLVLEISRVPCLG